MTKEQIEMAETMLESGCSYSQVARNLQIARQTVSRYFKGKYPRFAAEAGVIKSCEASRGLAEWMRENNVSIRALADSCYVSEGTICRFLYKGKASKTTMTEVCRVTGRSEDALLKK